MRSLKLIFFAAILCSVSDAYLQSKKTDEALQLRQVAALAATRPNLREIFKSKWTDEAAEGNPPGLDPTPQQVWFWAIFDFFNRLTQVKKTKLASRRQSPPVITDNIRVM